ncbi:hypothetical protein NEIG_00479 [Nematocida sp. ERTm5]|nr:hypothetical protein NEIG_00479 [Nematocida sp. ERTm5]
MQDDRILQKECINPSEDSMKTLSDMEIYRIFTQEREIPLSQNVIKYIKQHMTYTTIEIYADIIKANYTTGILTEEAVHESIKNIKKERRIIEISPVKYTPEGIKRYKILKDRIIQQKNSIVTLKPNVNSIIFGMVRISDSGRIEIDDEDDSVTVSEIKKNEYFLGRGICAGFEGVLTENGYSVEKIHLPESKVHNNSSILSIPNFIVISQFIPTEESIKRINNILKVYTEYEISLCSVIIMVHERVNIINVRTEIENKISGEYKEIEFILIPGVGSKYFYPHGECSVYRNISLGTNPCEVKIENNVFLIGSFDLIDGIREECVFNGDFRKELSKTLLTQASFNPFIHYTDLSYTEDFLGMIIGDSYDCFTHTHNNQIFSVCGDFEKSEGQFLFFNGAERVFEICSYGDLSTE